MNLSTPLETFKSPFTRVCTAHRSKLKNKIIALCACSLQKELVSFIIHHACLPVIFSGRSRVHQISYSQLLFRYIYIFKYQKGNLIKFCSFEVFNQHFVLEILGILRFEKYFHLHWILLWLCYFLLLTH